MSVPDNEGWFQSSAIRLAARLRAGEISSAALVEAHIAFIQEVNPTLNAVVHDRFDAARQEALEADTRLAEGGDDLPPLLGVPCSVKEAIALQGMPWTSGLVARRGLTAPRDAPVVARIRAAGAIPLGVTNTSELCMWMESNNRVYGRTSNPYNPRHIVGGSSGGEGAIVGAGGAPFGLGSDIGGSIRLPSFFNGIFGHKATSRLVPVTGQYPPAENDARLMLSAGPMTRRAEDLMPVLRIIAGPDGEDGVTEERSLGDPAEVAMQGLKVLSVNGNGVLRISSDLRRSQGRAAAALGRLGCQVREGRIRGLRRSFQVWSQRMSAAADTPFRTHLGEGTPISVGGELARWAVGRSAHTLPALALAVLEVLPGVDTDDAERVRDDVRALRDEVVEAIGEDGVMLYPVYTRVAPRHGWPIATPFDWLYTAVINALELPATSVPLGLDSQGLPLGLQVVGAPGQDHRTIAVALALEEALGGWVPPWRARP